MLIRHYVLGRFCHAIEGTQTQQYIKVHRQVLIHFLPSKNFLDPESSMSPHLNPGEVALAYMYLGKP